MSEKYQLTAVFYLRFVLAPVKKKIRDLVNLTLWEVLRIINLDFPHGII